MMEDFAQKPIGVFDSGVGGLTVARAVMARLPAERLVYLGDTARVPYGMRSQQTVLRYSRNAARFLLQQSVKLVLVACNTASAAALETLREELPVGVLGAVAPGASAAAQATKSGVVGVIGTLATIRSQAYERALAALRPGLQVKTVACPLLVPLVEEGWTASTDLISELVVRRYLTAMREAEAGGDIDTLVLGCTHYPLLAAIINKVAGELWSHPITLVDSAQAMAEATAALLEQSQLLAPNHLAKHFAQEDSQVQSRRLTCFVTDEARVAEVAARFLGQELSRIQLVDL